MQLPAPARAPSFISRRRLFDQQIADLDKCTDLKRIKQLHAVIYRSNLYKDPFIAPKLVSALSLCRQMGAARQVFDQIPHPNAHLYNMLIKGYVKNHEPRKGFEVFGGMKVEPDCYTYLYLLKGSFGMKVVEMVHAHVKKLGFYEDLFVYNTLINGYNRCGLEGVMEGKRVFDAMEVRDVVTYNSMITGLVKVGELEEAKKVFDEMPERDKVSWNAILDGYVKAGEMNGAFELFERMPLRDVVSWSTVISGYARIGDMDTAKMLFDKMPEKNLVSWTIIISGYAKKGLLKEAMSLYNRMEEAGVKLDEGTYVSIISASAESGLLCLGKRVHQSISKTRFKCSLLVNNALIDMYGKCGCLSKAWRVFDSIRNKDLVSWNSLIHAVANHGLGHKALQLFSRMKQEGFTPDTVTFVGILSACNHSGLINEGISYFESMEKDYGIVPEIEHYGCMIDLLGRGGRLTKAFRLLHVMPFKPNLVIWSSLLGACQMHKEVQFAEDVLNQLLKLDPGDIGNYSMLSNLYAAVEDWESVSSARLQMKKSEIKRPPGVSSIELNNELHEFTVMDRTHPKSDSIYDTISGLSALLKKTSYAPSLETEFCFLD